MSERKACVFCDQPFDEGRAIQNRIGRDPSFAELWKRLDLAERDRNRMLNALQHVRDQKIRGKITMAPRDMHIINRALSKVEPSLALPKPAHQQGEG